MHVIHLGNEQMRVGPIEWAGQTVTLVGAESGVWVDTRWFAFEAVYRRPVRLEVAGDERLSVLDFVMLTRIAVIVLSMMAASRRLFR